MKEIKEIIDMGRRLDELTCEVYTQFAKRDDFDPALITLWKEMAEWKKGHLKHWKKISKSFAYRNLFSKSSEDLKTIIKQMKNIQSELVEFLRRLRKKTITQNEAVSQTILNEFCMISDIFLEIFYTYGETLDSGPSIFVKECGSHLMRMADVLKPYMKLNPLYAVLLKSLVEFRYKFEFLETTYGKKRKAAG
ncbi:MAG: hypothetical protein OEW04_03950 [Nitrospirota bacterium]|nr:hypothetical protein [Nitrospirota bacterium]